jgi:copper chaperone
METLTFKTNIKCTGCLAKVGPVLNQEEGIEKWEVDLENPDKTLRVESAHLSAGDIKAKLKQIGYEAEEIS